MEEHNYPNNIAMIRKIRGFTQAYVAEQIGVSRPKYIDIEKGLKELTVSQVEKLKELFDANFYDLIGIETGNFNFRKFIKDELIKKKKDEKHFKEWINLKEKIHFGNSAPKISEGDIWWCGFGENIGIEINGKSARFSRPVLIMKKLSHQGFMGIPLTSQEKSGSWYAKFTFLDKPTLAAISQARVMSSSRLYSKIGQIPETDLKIVNEAFHKLYE